MIDCEKHQLSDMSPWVAKIIGVVSCFLIFLMMGNWIDNWLICFDLNHLMMPFKFWRSLPFVEYNYTRDMQLFQFG